MCASVCASSVLPQPVGPISRNVRLRQLDVVVLALVIEPLVVIVDRDREHLLGVILADNIVIENLADFSRRRDAVARLH